MNATENLMKTKLTSHSKYLRKLYIASLSAAMLTVQVRHAGAQTEQDMIEVARSVVAADRKAVVVAVASTEKVWSIKASPVGEATLTEVNVGPQVGGGTFYEVIFFETAESLANFKEGHFEMSAKVDAIAAAEGAALNAKYREGVIVFTLPRGGHRWAKVQLQATAVIPRC
jgi:hypothetical protein